MLVLLAQRHLDPRAPGADEASVAAWANPPRSPIFDRLVVVVAG